MAPIREALPEAPIREAQSPDAPAAARSGPPSDVEMKEVSEKTWLADTRQKVATRLKVDPATLRFSPSKRLIACVREVAPGKQSVKRPPPRRHQIIVVDPDGNRRALFEAVRLRGSDEPPKDFRFFAEDRLIYEVVQAPPAPAPVAKKRAAPARRPARGKRPARVLPPTHLPPSDPAVPHRLLVIQPIEARQRPIRCDGVRFAFTGQHDHFAFVAGKPEAEFVSVDGVQVYPRRGRTIIASDPAWSRDGRSLAFVETPAAGKPRLVLLAEFDNPTGDTNWELPASASAPAAADGVRVLWNGPGKLVVARSPTKPLFSASFVKEKPVVPVERFKNAGP